MIHLSKERLIRMSNQSYASYDDGLMNIILCAIKDINLTVIVTIYFDMLLTIWLILKYVICYLWDIKNKFLVHEEFSLQP